MGTPTVADTDALIDYFSGRDPMAGRVRTLLAAGDLAVTTVSLFELACGARTPREMEDVRGLGNALLVLPLTNKAALEAAQVWQSLHDTGRALDTADTLIAGCCLASGLPLLTRNAEHFSRVRGLALAESP